MTAPAAPRLRRPVGCTGCDPPSGDHLVAGLLGAGEVAGVCGPDAVVAPLLAELAGGVAAGEPVLRRSVANTGALLFTDRPQHIARLLAAWRKTRNVEAALPLLVAGPLPRLGTGARPHGLGRDLLQAAIGAVASASVSLMRKRCVDAGVVLFDDVDGSLLDGVQGEGGHDALAADLRVICSTFGLTALVAGRQGGLRLPTIAARVEVTMPEPAEIEVTWARTDKRAVFNGRLVATLIEDSHGDPAQAPAIAWKRRKPIQPAQGEERHGGERPKRGHDLGRGAEASSKSVAANSDSGSRRPNSRGDA